MTKVVLNAMTRALAEDLAGTGILVNAISPGWRWVAQAQGGLRSKAARASCGA